MTENENKEKINHYIKVYHDWDDFFNSECKTMNQRRMKGSSLATVCLDDNSYSRLVGGEALFLQAPLPKLGTNESAIADFSNMRVEQTETGNRYYILVRIFSSVDGNI